MPDLRSNQSSGSDIQSFLKGEEFSSIIKAIVREENGKLLEEIKVLKNEIVILRESNIQLLHVVMNKDKPWNKIVERNDDNVKMVPKNTAKKTISKKERVNAPPAQKINVAKEINTESLPSAGEEKLLNNNWTEVARRENRRSNIIRGSNNTETDIQGAVRYAHLHIYRLAPTVTTEKLKNFIVSKNIRDPKCEQLVSRHPEEYSSFKVSVPMEYLEMVKQPHMWPENVCINRFFHRVMRKIDKI